MEHINFNFLEGVCVWHTSVPLGNERDKWAKGHEHIFLFDLHCVSSPDAGTC